MAYFKRKRIFIIKFLFTVLFAFFLKKGLFSADKETGALYYE